MFIKTKEKKSQSAKVIFVFCAAMFIFPCLSKAEQKENEAPPAKQCVKVDGRVLITDFDLDGKFDPYFIKGVIYNPIPIGFAPDDPRLPNPLDNAQILERDFTLLREINANTIYIPHGNDTSSRDGSALKLTARTLEMAQQYGLKVIAGFNIKKTNFNNPSERRHIQSSFIAYLNTFKRSKGILFWAINGDKKIFAKPGVEAGNIQAFFSLINQLAYYAHSAEGFAQYHPVALAIDDQRFIANSVFRTQDNYFTYVDIWGMGLNPVPATAEALINTYALKSRKPLWITEFGIDAWNVVDPQYPDPSYGYEDEDAQADIAATLWGTIAAKNNITIGGTIKEYLDAWWPDGRYPADHDFNGSMDRRFPDGYRNDEWFGIAAIQPDASGGPDVVTPRKAFYALQEKFFKPLTLALPRLEFSELKLGVSCTASNRLVVDFKLKNNGGAAFARAGKIKIRVINWAKSAGKLVERYQDFTLACPRLNPQQEWNFNSTGKWTIYAAPQLPGGLSAVIAYVETDAFPIYGARGARQAAFAISGEPYHTWFVDSVNGNDITGNGSKERPWKTMEASAGNGAVSARDKLNLVLEENSVLPGVYASEENPASSFFSEDNGVLGQEVGNGTYCELICSKCGQSVCTVSYCTHQPAPEELGQELIIPYFTEVGAVWSEPAQKNWVLEHFNIDNLPPRDVYLIPPSEDSRSYTPLEVVIKKIQRYGRYFDLDLSSPGLKAPLGKGWEIYSKFYRDGLISDKEWKEKGNGKAKPVLVEVGIRLLRH